MAMLEANRLDKEKIERGKLAMGKREADLAERDGIVAELGRKFGERKDYTPTSESIAIAQMSHQSNIYANQWGWMYDPALGFAFALHRSLPLEVLELATGRFYHRQALMSRYLISARPTSYRWASASDPQPSSVLASLPRGWVFSFGPAALSKPIPDGRPSQQPSRVPNHNTKKPAESSSNTTVEQPQSKSKGGKAQETGKPKASGRAKGQGAKSKANRREPGASDEETGDLTKQQAAAADIKLPDPTEDRIEWSDDHMKVVVEYICDQEIKDKWKTRKSEVFTHISQKLVKNKASVAQVRNLWNRIWDKYKACRRRQKHTGGGDPDEDEVDEDEREDSPAADESSKAKKKTKKKKKKTGFSDQVLDDFESSAIYEMIDQAFHDDPSAVPEEVFSSLSKLVDVEKEDNEEVAEKKEGKRKRSVAASSSDGEGYEEGPSGIVSSIVATMKEKNERMYKTDNARLAMEERREERERAESDRKRKREEAEDARREADLREENIAKWMEEYRKIKDSEDEMEQMRAAYLRKKLKEAMALGD
ncbi:hypothetical protein FRC00_014371 [Tulasnella sp. 408]|nr:hypothetical protein FRC00_014371 [Tulasnella sp. 408]